MKKVVFIAILFCIVGCNAQYDQDGYNSEGYNWWGYDRGGSNRNNRDLWGRHRNDLMRKQESIYPTTKEIAKLQRDSQLLEEHKETFAAQLNNTQQEIYKRFLALTKAPESSEKSLVVVSSMRRLKDALGEDKWQMFVEILYEENTLKNQAAILQEKYKDELNKEIESQAQAQEDF